MPRTPEMWTYRVTGRRSGGFPLDMLRYGECWPTTGDDAVKIGKLLMVDGIDWTEDSSRRVTISLTTARELAGAPGSYVTKRWESMGFTVSTNEDVCG